MNRKTLRAKVAADLLDKIRKVENCPRVEGDSLRFIRYAKTLYEIVATREGYYEARPR